MITFATGWTLVRMIEQARLAKGTVSGSLGGLLAIAMVCDCIWLSKLPEIVRAFHG